MIPKLQRQVNQLAKARVRQVRRMADRINETVAGVRDIRANDATQYERSRFSRELGVVFDIRFKIYKKKFFIKFINNFLAQLGPFFFFSIGGYLVIMGELTLGALVAVIGAQKELYAPWKELLTYYQLMMDVHIKYEQVVAQFDPAGHAAGRAAERRSGAGRLGGRAARREPGPDIGRRCPDSGRRCVRRDAALARRRSSAPPAAARRS